MPKVVIHSTLYPDDIQCDSHNLSANVHHLINRQVYVGKVQYFVASRSTRGLKKGVTVKAGRNGIGAVLNVSGEWKFLWKREFVLRVRVASCPRRPAN